MFKIFLNLQNTVEQNRQKKLRETYNKEVRKGRKMGRHRRQQLCTYRSEEFIFLNIFACPKEQQEHRERRYHKRRTKTTRSKLNDEQNIRYKVVRYIEAEHIVVDMCICMCMSTVNDRNRSFTHRLTTSRTRRSCNGVGLKVLVPSLAPVDDAVIDVM